MYYYGLYTHLLVQSLLLLEERVHAATLLVALGPHLLEHGEGRLELLLDGPQLGLLLGFRLAGGPVPVLRSLHRLQWECTSGSGCVVVCCGGGETVVAIVLCWCWCCEML